MRRFRAFRRRYCPRRAAVLRRAERGVCGRGDRRRHPWCCHHATARPTHSRRGRCRGHCERGAVCGAGPRRRCDRGTIPIVRGTVRVLVAAIVVVVAILRSWLPSLLPLDCVGPVALGAGFVLASLVVGNDAEIMVGKLQVVFRLHRVVVKRGVLRQLLVLIQHLRRIATRAIVDAVGLHRIAACRPTGAIAVAATTAVVVTIVIQGIRFLRSDR